MANFDNVSEVEAFIGRKAGQFIAKNSTKAYTIWVYEAAIVKIFHSKKGDQPTTWVIEGGQEKFVHWNPSLLKFVSPEYVKTERWFKAEELWAESNRVYKGMQSALDDFQKGIKRDTSKIKELEAWLNNNKF